MTEETLFTEALEIADPADRAAFLDRACAGDPAVRGRLDRLLARYAQAGDFLGHPPALPPTGPPDPPAGGSTAAPPPARSEGGTIGPFKLVEVIGEGGMGTVWLAQQVDPVKRLVALKVIKAGMDTRQVVARFEAERQALALMDHPNIAKVLDGGVTPDGRPFFVMELVKGVPVTRFCDERRLTPRERLELFVPVCQAVQHAHQKGVIHRDLKPSNVLVALYDGRPVPKVIDFGIAKATGQPLTEKTLITGLGAVVGTPEYMSPEQAELNQLDIDTRSDIYSLGVLLYELLTGSTPLQKRRVREAALLEVLRLVREEEPPRPSTRLSTTDELPSIAANRGVEPRKLSGLVRGELDWIVMKALEKDRSRRYETANGFAMDVQRYLADETVQACPPSAAYRLKKFVRRNRAPLTLAGALGLLLLGAGAVAWYADRQAAGRERVEQARLGRNAEAVAALLDQCEDAVRADRADRAAVALEAAERRAADGGAEELAGRLARCRADLGLLRELNAVDVLRGTPAGGRLRRVRDIVPQWRAALAAYGVTPDGDPIRVAGRLIESLVRDRALTALDLWLGDDPAPGLRALLQAVDPDPYRDSVRAAIAAKDNPAVAALAARPEALNQPGWFAAMLSQHGAVPVERRRAVLQAALRARPGDLVLLVSMGNSYAGGRRSAAERVRWFQSAVAAHPESPVALNNLGIVLDDLKDFDAAIAACREAIRLDPQNASFAHSNLGASLTNKGNPDAAIVEFQKSLHLNPKNAGALVNWGHALEVKKDRKGAIAKYWEAIGIDQDLGQARLMLGIALAKNGDPDGAIAQYEAAIRIDRSDVHARTNLGCILADKGKPDEALALFKEAIRIDPTYALAHTNKGVALWEMGGRDEAMIELREAVQLDPQSALARANLGGVLMSSGELEAGLVEMRKAVELEPEDVDHRRNLAVGLSAAGDLNGAIAEFEVLIKRDPKDVTARNFLAIALRQHGELSRAMLLFQQLATEFEQGGFRHANAGGIVNSLVVCHEQLGQFDQAEAWMRKFLARGKDRASVDSLSYAADLAWLGQYLLRRGKWKEAEAVLQQSLAIRKRRAPDSWSTFKTASMVGDALLGQKKYLDAERPLLDGYSGLLKHFKKGLAAKYKVSLGESTQRLVQLYDAMAKKDEAAKWRTVLEQNEGPKVGGVHEVGDGLKLYGKFDGQVNTMIYEVKLSAGKTYFIDLAHLGRQSLNPYVAIQDADRRPLDDDFGSGLPARIAYRVPRDGVYRILAASNISGPGEFTLTVREKKDLGKPAAATPKTADEWNVRGAELEARKDLAGAIGAFRKGLEIDDKDPTLWFNLGLALQKNKDQPGAIAAYETAVALDSKEAVFHNALAWLLATCSDPKLRDPGRAVTHAKEAVKLAPKNPNYPSTLGAAYYRARDWRAAIAALDESMKMREGGDAHEWFFLAMAHWQLGEKDKAREWYERAAKWMDKHQPDSDELRRFRAEAAEVLGTEKKKE